MSAFTDAFERGTEGLRAFSVGACPGCSTCGLDDEPTEEEREVADESYFSWSDCDTCGSSLGGDRHPAHYLNEENEVEHLDVCTDCLMFAANGDEPESWEE